MGFIGQFSALLKQLPYIPSIISLSIYIIQNGSVSEAFIPTYKPTLLSYKPPNLLGKKWSGWRDTHPWLVIINLFSKLTAAKDAIFWQFLNTFAKFPRCPIFKPANP